MPRVCRSSESCCLLHLATAPVPCGILDKNTFADVAGEIFLALCCARLQVRKPTTYDVRCPKSSQAEKTECVRYVCGFFLLGYSSHIGNSLALAFGHASGAAYSANPPRPFAPRPTRCAVCRSLMARCYVCHRRPPYKRNRRTFDVLRSAARKICFSVSLGRSLLAGGGSLFPPCLRACSPFGAQSPSLSFAPAARRMSECANALPLWLACDFGASYSVAPLRARHLPRFSLRRLHPSGVRASGGRARPATQAAV